MRAAARTSLALLEPHSRCGLAAVAAAASCAAASRASSTCGTSELPESQSFLYAAALRSLLRRQKSDVLKGDDSLAPLQETIVWVEMTKLQKKMYKGEHPPALPDGVLLL